MLPSAGQSGRLFIYSFVANTPLELYFYTLLELHILTRAKLFCYCLGFFFKGRILYLTTGRTEPVPVEPEQSQIE